MALPASAAASLRRLRTAAIRPLALARLAARSWSARRARSPAARRQALARVVAQLGRMHGLPQKIGQILASAELDADAPAFAPLTAHTASALPFAQARAIVRGHLGHPLEESFAEFADDGLAASIGQVHRARLRDGRAVAVKFQHPGIAATLAADLGALGWLAAPLGNLRRGFDLAGYRAELGARLRSELDYAAEAAALQAFTRDRAGATDVLLPETIEELRRPGLLVQTWLDGADIAEARLWPASVRAALGSTLVRIFLEGLLRDRLLHADPHPGNYRFVAGGPHGVPAVGILDFGSMHRVTAAESGALADAIRRAGTGGIDDDFARQFHAAFGFDDALLSPLGSRLAPILRELLRPVAQPGPFQLKTWHPGETLSALLGPDRIAYRIAAPPSFLFLIRAWHGLVHYLRALGEPVDWVGLAEPLQRGTRPGAPVTAAPRPDPASATVLHVRVCQDDTEKVRLDLPGELAGRLPDLIPHEHRARLAAAGFDPDRLARVARDSGYASQTLFTAEEEGRSVQIWIDQQNTPKAAPPPCRSKTHRTIPLHHAPAHR